MMNSKLFLKQHLNLEKNKSKMQSFKKNTENLFKPWNILRLSSFRSDKDFMTSSKFRLKIWEEIGCLKTSEKKSEGTEK